VTVTQNYVKLLNTFLEDFKNIVKKNWPGFYIDLTNIFFRDFYKKSEKSSYPSNIINNVKRHFSSRYKCYFKCEIIILFQILLENDRKRLKK